MHWTLKRLLIVWLTLPLVSPAASLPEAVEGGVRAIFPELDRLGEMTGEPPAAEVFGAGGRIGFALLTDRVKPIPAYSGKPVSALVGFDLEGTIRGVRIISHQEPILVVGVSERDLARFTDQYAGLKVADDIRVGGEPAAGRPVVDGLSGATITVMVVNASIVRSVRDVAESRGLLKRDEHGARRFEPPPPLWVSAWKERPVRIGVLATALVLLLAILLFQDWLARRPKLLGRLRTGYLLFTLLFIGWYGLAQLSVVNVLTFVGALVSGFRWESFLIDPLMFLLWSFVAMTILLWGRGVYCGWLCPFGALQELTFRLGGRLGIRPYEPPALVHDRLWAIKYLLLLALFGLSLHSLPLAEQAAELEPFKTVVALRFQREWPFIAYAVALILASLLVRKLFCRYLCVLGAALTFPSRFRIFDWLRRRKECGRPCRTCAAECEVQAIRPTGEINDLECHYCLDCQVTYWNDHKCPPLVERRRKSERRLQVKLGLERERSRSSERSAHP